MLSYTENIPAILEAVLKVDPKTVLDVGAGFGKFSLLVKEAIYSHRAEQGDLEPVDDVSIHCAEMARYFQTLDGHLDLYDFHHHYDVRGHVLLGYDLVLMIDVAEHWLEREVKEFIERSLRFSSWVLVSTPKRVVMYDAAYYGRDCPGHRTQFDYQFFRRLRSTNMLDYSTDLSWIFLLN